MLHFRIMADKTEAILFDYSCGICGKDTKNKKYPVVFKPTQENILVCETCLSFIKDNGEFSSYGVV